jgi:SAM-dependent methyltransferase
VTNWTDDMAIQQWGTMPRAALEQMAHDGDFAKRHLVNPVLLSMLGDLTGLRILDAGCGNGYLSRMLAERGARVTGVEPGQSLYDFAVEQETLTPQGIRYVQSDLCALPDLGGPFDAGPPPSSTHLRTLGFEVGKGSVSARRHPPSGIAHSAACPVIFAMRSKSALR